MSLMKSHWTADETGVHLSVPIEKVDKERRLVSGFATLDNIDTSDDVVTAEASEAAFSKFRGNLREMHQPIAAGKMVDFKEEEFFHDGEFYRGIFVTVYVSKGAPATWEKVLDGTLSGFSIGGNITEQESKFVKDAGENGKVIRFIKAYDLVELSLVDNPANQLSNIFSIVKNSDGTFIKGMVAETVIYNIFWCSEDEIAINSTNETLKCSACNASMQRIGWFEKGEDAAQKTAAAVGDFLRQKEVGDADNQVLNTEDGEGGVEMSKNNSEKNAEVETEEVLEKSEEVSEVEPEETEEEVVDSDSGESVDEEGAEEEVVEEAPLEPDFEKMFDDLKDSVKETIEKTVEQVEEKISEATKAFDAKASEFEKGLEEMQNELEEARKSRDDVAKRIDALEDSAIRKSGDVELEPVEKKRKGLWAGTFFDAE